MVCGRELGCVVGCGCCVVGVWLLSRLWGYYFCGRFFINPVCCVGIVFVVGGWVGCMGL